MDKHGYERIVAALRDEPGLGMANVAPIPEDGENVRYLTVETHADVPPALVLNALNEASLLRREGPRDLVRRNGPELECVSAVPEAVTLEDKAVR